ncbi:hypothetical protein CFC21_001618 [Triticum aestivum]|uniref:Uncharacterized protein n=2 Tax=Triticum aestivum TaxID=4565 RepID=A0A3B5Y1G4_WHEAT|nr:uncharacterized protein LOC123054046 isoform X3 [Triticum aestivum]KAF6983429.1 hypothetical protein CFC21_001618 [Triticum aestivum]
MMGSSGSGNGSRHLDPGRVHELVMRRKPYDLLHYLNSIPGASEDPHCRQIKYVAETLLLLMRRGLVPGDKTLIVDWARNAWLNATQSRLFSSQMVGGGPSNFTSDAGYNMHPHNSSSYSGRMLTNEPGSNDFRHAAMHNQLSASNPRNHTATFPPQQANSTDAYVPLRNNSKLGHDMHPHNSSSYSGRMSTNEPGLRDTATHNQLSASYSRNHTATFPQLQLNSNDVMLDETFAFNPGTHASAYVPSGGYYTLGHKMHPQNSNSNSGRMLTNKPGSNGLRDTATHNQLSASYSQNHTATFPQLQLNSNDVILDETSTFNPGTHASEYVPSRGYYTLGHNMHPHNSSSYSERMLTNEPCSNEVRDAAMHNQLSASNSRNYTATFPPVQANSNDVPLDETSAFNSGTHASAYVPLRDNPTLAQAFNELLDNIFSPQKHGTGTVGPLWPCHPGSEQKRKVLPTVDIKGKRPASMKVTTLRLNVASLVAEDGINSAAGVLIRNGSTAQFVGASCFSPILRREPALLLAAACCKGIKIALSYQPASITLESHLLPLLNPLYASSDQPPDVVQLKEFLSQGYPHFVVRDIPEESNRAACELALNVLHLRESYMFFNDPPEWLVPYLDQ